MYVLLKIGKLCAGSVWRSPVHTVGSQEEDWILTVLSLPSQSSHPKALNLNRHDVN